MVIEALPRFCMDCIYGAHTKLRHSVIIVAITLTFLTMLAVILVVDVKGCSGLGSDSKAEKRN